MAKNWNLVLKQMQPDGNEYRWCVVALECLLCFGVTHSNQPGRMEEGTARSVTAPELNMRS
eukprot:4090133-Amphidinium_carterae.1